MNRSFTDAHFALSTLADILAIPGGKSSDVLLAPLILRMNGDNNVVSTAPEGEQRPLLPVSKIVAFYGTLGGGGRGHY